MRILFAQATNSLGINASIERGKANNGIVGSIDRRKDLFWENNEDFQ